MAEVLVIGAGPAGVMAASRAADLGARTILVTRGEFGGMAANDGPVPVRTLAHAARLASGIGQLDRYGLSVGAPSLDLPRLLDRAREVVAEVRSHAAFRDAIDRLGVVVCERAGSVRFLDPHVVMVEDGSRIRAERIIVCAGGTSRRLPVPGGELGVDVSHVWCLTEIPASMVVVGAGMTGVQIASIYQALGSRVQLFQADARILPTEDEEVSSAVAAAFRRSGMEVHEACGAIERLERTAGGVRMTLADHRSVEAALVVTAIGWVADTAGLDLPAAQVATDARGFVAVDEDLRTSSPHVYAAGDITGRWMLVPQAVHDGWRAATHAVRGDAGPPRKAVCPIGGFTEPEYARVGLTQAQARERHDLVTATVRFDETTRAIIDGRTEGFCKLLADRRTRAILGCSVVGERAAEIVQTVAIAMASGFPVDELARVALSFPTYTGILARAAYRAAAQLGLEPPGAFDAVR
jgi:pyruvate/2-oxoglutarate dehydrogenase complex dihydrolipoamide dehydrogenase (E3) component